MNVSKAEPFRVFSVFRGYLFMDFGLTNLGQNRGGNLVSLSFEVFHITAFDQKADE
jgi:hypothetical protein